MGKGIQALLGLVMFASAPAIAAVPCDFKGLWVGDKATPQQIMKRFGIDKFADSDAQLPDAQQKAEFDARMKRGGEVGLFNAFEEERWKRGPSCSHTSCEIPYGVTVGSSVFPIPVSVFVSFDKTGTIEAIDVGNDTLMWDEVRALLNTKYGDNWSVTTTPSPLTDFAKKKAEMQDLIELAHRTPGTNQKTGDKCTIYAKSQDRAFLHTTIPVYRSELEIKVISKNF